MNEPELHWCEALLSDGRPCGAPVHGQLEKYQTLDGRELTVCVRCRRHGIASALAARGNRIQRNDPCPCASGRKFKKCHGASTRR